MPKKEAVKSEVLTALIEAAKDINAKIKLSQPIPVGGKQEQIVEAIKAEGDHPDGGFYDTDKLSEETIATLATIGVEIKSKGGTPAAAAPAETAAPVAKTDKPPKAEKAEKPPKVEKVKRLNRPASVYAVIHDKGSRKNGIGAEELETLSTAMMTKANGKPAGAADRICVETLAALVEFGVMERLESGACRLVK